MATNRITIDLDLIAKNFDRQMGAVTQGIENQFAKLTQGLNTAMFGAGGGLSVAAWTKAFDIIQDVGTKAFRAIGNEINRSMKYQEGLIGIAASYQSMLKMSFGDAEKLAKKSNIVFAREAANLPFQKLGGTLRASYGDDLLSVFYDQNDVDGSLKRVGSLIGRLQVLVGSVSGTTNFQQMSFIGNSLSDNISKLRRLEVYRNAPNLQRALDKEVTDIGGDEKFNQLGREDRIKLLERVAKNAISDDVVSAYANTLDGMVNRTMMKFFGDTGIFSFTRELFNIGDNNVINSLTSLFKELFNPNGIFGLFFEFLRGVADGFLITVKTFMDVATIVLKPLNMLAWVLKPLSPLIYGLSTALTILATVGLARATASTVKSIYAQGIGGFLSGSGLGFLTPGVSLMGSMVNPANIIGGLKGLVATGGATISSGFLAMGTGIKTFGVSLLALGANPVFWVVAAVVGAIALAGYTLWKYWKPLGQFFSGFWEGLIEGLAPASFMLEGFKDILEGIADALSPIAEGFKSIYRAMQPALEGIGDFFNGKQEEGTKEHFEAGKSLGKSTGGFLGKLALGALLTGGTNPLIGLSIPNFASGNDPYGVMDAIARESSAMPTGASLALANTSEMIIPRSQQGMFGNKYNFSPTINIANGGSPGVVSDITNALNVWWQQVKLENV
jgi:hypothetical protein